MRWKWDLLVQTFVCPWHDLSESLHTAILSMSACELGLAPTGNAFDTILQCYFSYIYMCVCHITIYYKNMIQLYIYIHFQYTLIIYFAGVWVAQSFCSSLPKVYKYWNWTVAPYGALEAKHCDQCILVPVGEKCCTGEQGNESQVLVYREVGEARFPAAVEIHVIFSAVPPIVSERQIFHNGCLSENQRPQIVPWNTFAKEF